MSFNFTCTQYTAALHARWDNIIVLMFFVGTLFYFIHYQTGTLDKPVVDPAANSKEHVEIARNVEESDSIIGTARKVVIGAVSCRNLTGPDTLKYSEETVVMLKSVLISAKLYSIFEIELHLFLEHQDDKEYFIRNLREMGWFSEGSKVRLQLFIHNAVVATIPMDYRGQMIYHPRYRCGYTRFFFPSALPDVDAIIHLDSDMIITGNLWKIWSQFDTFQDNQLIGVAPSNEKNDKHYLKMYKRWFGDIPHPPPKGVNAGLLLMNLTKMREYDWEQNFLKVYEKYFKRVRLTGQRTCNILLAQNLTILKQLSCQFNFFHRHCDKEFTCLDALDKTKGGIHLIHGNGFRLEKGKIFYSIFMNYKNFDMTLINNLHDMGNGREELVAILKTHLMFPIRQYYSIDSDCSLCYGTLDEILFADFVSNEATNKN